jgi:catalase
MSAAFQYKMWSPDPVVFPNIAEAMQGVSDEIIERQLGHFEKVHPGYASGIRTAIAELANK